MDVCMTCMTCMVDSAVYMCMNSCKSLRIKASAKLSKCKCMSGKEVRRQYKTVQSRLFFSLFCRLKSPCKENRFLGEM